MSAAKIIHGLPEGQDARYLISQARDVMAQDGVCVHVCLDDKRADVLQELISFFAPEVDVVVFPAWDCLPYDRVSPNTDIIAARVAALKKMLVWEGEAKRYPRIVLTTVNAIHQKVMPRGALENASFSAQKSGQISLDDLQNFLALNGYIRTETVREAGEFAMRGGIIDVFPAGHENPIRMDLFGDEVESIKIFDAGTQVTTASIDQFSLYPAKEFFLDEKSIENFRQQYRELFGAVSKNDVLYESVSAGRLYNGVEHWLPLFYEGLDTALDYISSPHVTCDHLAQSAAEERVEQILDFYQARQSMQESKGVSGGVYYPIPADSLYITGADYLLQYPHFSPFGGEENSAKVGRDFADVRAMQNADVFAELNKYLAGYAEQKHLIACYSVGSLSRLQGLLENAGFNNCVAISTPEQLKKLKPHQTGLCILHLERGFVASDLVVVTEQDILGDRLARRAKKKRKADNFLTEVSSLNEGDLIVHIDHGVGRFLALETVQVGKLLHDCLKIEYQGGDKLFVPVENMDILSRFGGSEQTTVLDKLGGAGWQARKAKVKEDLMAMADDLLKIAAARMLKKAPKFEVPPEVYSAFAAKFPYDETEDQQHAITNTLDDLTREYPMDRLICGDVGFGKTEVAMRAAYVTAMDGAQVAVVAPTTLLARQHYKNFSERFANSGLVVRQLSRMVTAKEAAEVREGLANGSVNIVIGTHALFSQQTQFNNLGLLVIDEEQRFGVKQKERLKELKNNVHVLTLTATPIPRTLQMSLTGVKELSLITTPPVDRLAVRTFILPFDPVVIREALLREHYRGGQSFVVCPRISDMDEVEKDLKELVPEIKIVTAHGQMAASELDQRMTEFHDGQYDVLLATNIIESGIDIPTANTMVIHRADMFGLAQLYQIRGRIGRSKVRAYAYLTYEPRKKLNDNAIKRLEVMETLDTLGAGFQLASYDMDIRGAGNLLGEKQSGHIKEVGVELYQQMLEDAVAAARAGHDFDEIESGTFSPQINIGTSVLIPETYITDLGVRMSLYRRLSDLENEDDIESFAAELIDRFGDFPSEVQNLLDITRIKQLCIRAGVGSIEVGPKGAVIGFHENKPPNVEGLMRWISESVGTIKLRPDQKLAIMRVWSSPEKRTHGIKNMMMELSSLAS